MRIVGRRNGEREREREREREMERRRRAINLLHYLPRAPARALYAHGIVPGMRYSTTIYVVKFS
jgi:hypothetical protein